MKVMLIMDYIRNTKVNNGMPVNVYAFKIRMWSLRV